MSPKTNEVKSLTPEEEWAVKEEKRFDNHLKNYKYGPTLKPNNGSRAFDPTTFGKTVAEYTPLLARGIKAKDFNNIK